MYVIIASPQIDSMASFGRGARGLLREVHGGNSHAIVDDDVVVLLCVPTFGSCLGDGELDGALAGREVHAALAGMAVGVRVGQVLAHLERQRGDLAVL